LIQKTIQPFPLLMPRFTIFLLLISLLSINAVCPDDYFTQNSDCDTQGTLLQYGNYTSQKILDSNWAYFFLPFSGTEGRHIVLEIQKEGDSLKVFLQVKAISLHHEFYIEEDNKPLSFYVPISEKGGDLVIGVQDPVNKSFLDSGIKIRCFTEDEYNNLSDSEKHGKPVETERSKLHGSTLHQRSFSFGLLFGITAGVAFALTMGIGVYLLCLRESRPRLPWTPEVTGLLSSEEIEKYFPKINFETLQNTFHQNTCSICLEEFENETECRQLLCGHIYNDTCAQNWLSKHNNCPDCRRPMTKEAIEESLKAKALGKEGEKESANVSLMHHNQHESVLEIDAPKLEKKVLLQSV